MLAILLNLLNLQFTDDLKDVFQRLGSTVTPLALISVGLQLRIERRSKHWRFLVLGLTYQLILAPFLIYTLYYGMFGLRGEMIQITIIEAAMAPMITACIVAATYGLKPKLANMMIGFGIPVSFITLAFWYWFVQGI